MPTAVVIGGTGLIGQNLVNSLLANGYEVKVVSRSKLKVDEIFKGKVIAAGWNGSNSKELQAIISGIDVLINLAGHSIAVPWTKSNKSKIWKSRVDFTTIISTAINSCENPPRVYVQASAVGYYNYNSTEILNEFSPKGNGFLSNLVDEWEKQAMLCSSKTRVILLRTGIVLSSNGGFLPKILNPLKFYVGVTLGSGHQILPWIHIDDHIAAIQFLIEQKNAIGAFNIVSPHPVSLIELMKILGRKIKRPVFLKLPAFLLKLAMGEMAKEILLASQTIKPKKLEESEFEWRFADIDDALNNLLKQTNP